MRRCAVAVVASAALVLLAASPGAAAPSSLVPAAAAVAVRVAPKPAVTPLPSPSPSQPADSQDPTGGARPKDRGTYGSAKAPVPTEAPQIATDHVLVRFSPGASSQQRGSALHAAGVAAGPSVAGTGYVKVAVNGKDPEALVTALAGQPGVADAQLDHVRHLAGWTNDPAMSSAWPYFDLTRLPRAWDASTGTGAVVAVVDTGVTGTVPDLSGSVLPGIGLVVNADTTDVNGHGTAMAGIIAAHADNGIGSAGAAYGAKILPVRVLDANGDGTDSTIAAGISWAVAHGADVVNLSLAGPAPAPVILAAIQAAVASGVVVVAAAGNDGADAPQYPAAYAAQVDGLIAVAATDDAGARPAFSTRGDWVTLAAPGVDIVSPDTTTGYVTATGTSSSAAIVSGVAALLASHDPTLTPASIESRLVQSTRDAGPRGVDPYYGAGIVDAAGAVTFADADRAAVAVPLDEYPSDPGPTDETPATARTLTSTMTASATLSPEGDQDWYRVTVPAAGWWQVRVTPESGDGTETRPDPTLEVRDTAGAIIGEGDGAGRGSVETAYAQAPSDRVLVIGVGDDDGVASDVAYDLSVAAGSPPPFAASTQRGTTNGSGQALALSDVTGDGVPDALRAVGIWYSGAQVELYVGHGDGTFASPVAMPGSTAQTTGKGLVVFDANGDGLSDVAVTTTAGVQILLQEAGSLVDGGTVALPKGGYTLTSGDIDGDGDTDLVASTSVAQVYVLSNDGHGHFSVSSPAPSLNNTEMRLGDVSGDGRPDIVVPLGVFSQQPDGSFGPLTWFSLANPGGNQYGGVADVTGEGRAGVVLSSTDGTLLVLAQTPGGGLAAPVAYGPLPGHFGGPLALADFNGDGRTDVLIGASGSSSADLLVQRADGTLERAGSSPVDDWYNTLTWYPEDGLQAADLDGDGCVDAVLTVGGGLSVLHNRCDSGTHDPGWLAGITPASGSVGVAAGTHVTASFVRDLDPTSVGAASVRLREGQAGTPVPAAVSYNGTTRTVSLVPSADLVAGHHYELIVDGVKDSGGNLIDAPVRSWLTVAAGADRFTPMDPVRVADTRGGDWMPGSGQIGELSFAGLVPPEATSVVLNVTSTQAASVGNVRVFPAGLSSVPTISNLNIVAGVDQANMVTVALGTDQAVDFMVDAVASHLIVDLAGYYSPGGAAGYVPLSPVRVMDTRDGTGSVPAAPLVGGQTVDLTVAGVNGVPADAVAVVMNVTGTRVTGMTHLRVYPAPGSGEDQTPPMVSNVNLRAGRDQPNLVTVRVGDGGRVRFYTPAASVDVVADLVGYYSATGDNGFVPLSPFRAIDTRYGQGITGFLHQGVTANAVLAGVGAVPADATGLVLNVVGVHPSGQTHVRVFPTTDPNTLPNVSTLNLVAGRDEANLTIQPPGVGGQISFYPHSADMDLVVDISGYFHH